MIKTIGVLGAGLMGNGIAHLFAWHGYKVILCDNVEVQLGNAVVSIRTNLERQAEKGIVAAEDIPGIIERIMPTKEMSALASVDFLVEAVTESESLKLELFRRLDEAVKEEAILASNTSSISITRIAAATRRPERVIGTHFMNPVPVMRLVEIIRGQKTSDTTFAVTTALLATLEKDLAFSTDRPGFIVNRILIPMINEAIFALHDGVATKEDIDKAMQLGANQPMGPLRLADLIGLDTVLAIADVLYKGFDDGKYRPCPLLVEMVAAGKLGRKSGRGFYDY